MVKVSIPRTILNICNFVAFMIDVYVIPYHFFRLYINSKPRKKARSKIRWALEITSYSVLFSSLLNSIFNLMVIFHRPLSIPFCRRQVRGNIALNGINKLSLHLFVALRCVISSQTFKRIHLYFYLSLLLMLSDLGFILFVIFDDLNIRIDTSDNKCDMTNVKEFIFYWYGMNDGIIGIFTLILFIYPIYQRIKSDNSENESNNVNSITKEDNSVNKALRRVVKWSSLAIISTFIVTILSATLDGIVSLLFPVDQSTNSISVIMQFAPLNYDKIKNKSLKVLCNYLHLGYFTKKEKEKLEGVMSKTPHSITSSKFKSTDSINHPKSPKHSSNYNTTVNSTTHNENNSPKLNDISYSNNDEKTKILNTSFNIQNHTAQNNSYTLEMTHSSKNNNSTMIIVHNNNSNNSSGNINSISDKQTNNNTQIKNKKSSSGSDVNLVSDLNSSDNSNE